MVALEKQELDTIGQCLKAVISGPFLVDRDAADQWWEFQTVMGLEVSEVADVARRWPDVDFGAHDVQMAIGNSMNNLLWYPHGCWTEWSEYISVSPAEVERVLSKWRQAAGLVSRNSPSKYFNGAM